MRKRHCQGCSASEPEETNPHRIFPVRVTVIGEGKARSWEPEEVYEEDLCASCREALLVRFMGKEAKEGILDPPLIWRAAG